jgi:hypothetical protein
MEIIVITLYFAIEAGFGVSFELILPRKRCKIIIYFAVIAHVGLLAPLSKALARLSDI